MPRKASRQRDEPVVSVSVRLPESLVIRARIAAVRARTPMQYVIEDALLSHLATLEAHLDAGETP